MNKRMTKHLKKIARELPPALTQVKKNWTGAELLKMNPNELDEKGQPLNPSKIYVREDVEEVNHEKEIFARYKSGGVDAVGQYERDVIDYVKKEMDEI